MAKVPFEDEYAAFVAAVSLLLDGKPDSKWSAVKDPVDPNAPRTPYTRYDGIRYRDFSIEQHWTSGGTSGGSCWGDGGHYSRGSDPAPTTFEDLNNILEKYWPNITFLQYQKHIAPLFYSDSYTEHEYYGNSTQYTYNIISLRDLFVVFNENGILLA